MAAFKDRNKPTLLVGLSPHMMLLLLCTVYMYCIYVSLHICSICRDCHLFPVNDFVCMYNLCSRVWPDVFIFLC